MTDATDHFTALDVEASLCVWEWMNDRYNQRESVEPWAVALCALWEDVGSNAMRDIARRLGPAVNRFWGSLTENERTTLIPYDFGFIPMVCERLDWAIEMKFATHTSGLLQIPDTAKVEIRFRAWENVAAELAYEGFVYREVVEDDPDAARRAFDQGESPEDFVARVGQKFDLTAR